MVEANPYAVEFMVPAAWWMTTVDDDDPVRRKRRRGRLRAWARGVWKRARRHGAHPVDRLLMLVTVGGRADSPVLAAETLKPLIDAGTDEGLWPDDDPYHRVMTCYLNDPRPAPPGKARLYIWILPLAPRGHPLDRLLDAVPGVRGFRVRVAVPDDEWLTSNMRMTPGEHDRRASAIMRRARMAWMGRSIGASAAVVCAVRYPDSRPRYKGDPDNTAESATAVWGAGALEGLCPVSPSLFAFMLADGESEPHTHELDMLALATGPDVDWPGLLLGA